MNFVDWVQVVTQIVAAVTAVVMGIFAYKTYLRPPEQSEEAEPDNATDDSVDDVSKEIPVFKTSNQETFLYVLPDGLYCRLEDKRPGRKGQKWSLTKDQAKDILSSGTFHVNPGYKIRTGTFTLGPKRNWLYSKVLFPEPDDLKVVLEKLLKSAS